MSRFCLAALLLSLIPVAAFCQSAPDSGDVIINEIMYAPSTASNEYIELYNRSVEAVNLNRLEYADDDRDFAPVASADTLLDPGAYAVLVRDTAAFRNAFPSTSFLSPSGWDALNNGGDTVLLRDGPTEKTIDAVPYDPSWGGDDGSALERIDPAGPSDEARNFGTSEAAKGGTPAAENSLYAPDETPPTLERVRPTLNGDSLLARFSEPLDTETVTSSAFQLDAPDAPSIESATVSDIADAMVVCVLENGLSSADYTLVAVDVSDRRGNVQAETRASFQYFVPDAPEPKDLVVTEILYAPTPASNEFIEIYNRSQKTIDLGSLEYADENRDFAPVAPPLTPIEPEAHAVLVRDPDAFKEAFPDVSFEAPSGWDALNNGGDTVIVRHRSSGTILDTVGYEASWGGSSGASLERIDPAGPSNASSNFGSSDAAAGATPGARNSLYDPDEIPPAPVFAEQVAETTVEITFSEPLRASSVTAGAFDLASTSVTEVRLPSDTVASLTLADRPTDPTVQISGIEDRVRNERSTATIALAYRPTEGEMIVNELLFDPRRDDHDDRPNQVEYVEVLNRTGRSLTLRGLFMTDRPSEQGTADTLRPGRRTALPPDGYGVVAATPTGVRSARESQLAAAFPNAPLASDSVAFLPVDGQRLGLQNDGDRVRLHRADGTPLDEVTYTPDWHTPSLEETKGTALERISPSADASSDENWTSSTADAGGTPGTRNAVSLAPPDTTPSAGLQIEPSPFSIERDGATRIHYSLDDVPNLVRARIFDARGRQVRTLEQARLAGRTGELLWDGRNDDGRRVRIGVYVVHFEAVRADAGTVSRFKEPVVVARPLE